VGAVLYPLVRTIPGLYGLGIRYRIFRLYGELKLLDLEAGQRGPGEKAADLFAQLDHLEARARRLHVPVMYAQLLFALRRDIVLVRERLERPPDAAAGEQYP
jgi:hypothetical protein